MELNETNENLERLLFHNYYNYMENIIGKLCELQYVFYLLFRRFRASNTVTEEIIPKIDSVDKLISQLFVLMSEIIIDLD